jgi:4'-phosphopantetheinyl transferase
VPVLSFTPLADGPAPLAAGEVHVWLAPLDTTVPELAHYQTLLALDEEARAARFRFDRDRQHYIAARGILRSLLAHYTGIAAQSLRLVYNTHGKPALPDDHPCRFNLAHSHRWAVFGFTLEHDIGVDIERIRPDFAGEDIAQRFFSKQEAETLRALPESARTKAFFDCWTRKEAFIKAKGLGVFLGLQTFAVTLAPGEEAGLIWHDGEPDAAARWAMFELQTPEGYVGAAAVDGKELSGFGWPWDTRLFQKL